MTTKDLGRKTIATSRRVRRLLAAVCVAMTLLASPGAQLSAQNATPKTDSKILFNGGTVMNATSNIYFIWYGCWHDGCGNSGDSAAVTILSDFITSLGFSPYNQINAGYPNASGAAPTGGLIYGMDINVGYSRGAELTQSEVEDIVAEALRSAWLPVDPRGIYIVLASADISANDMGFCSTTCQLHRSVQVDQTVIKYTFVGDGARCPSTCASQFLDSGDNRLPTPNGNFHADAMVSWLAHAISGTLTNPYGTAWFDRYGLENSDKCAGSYGETYLTPSGARANVRLGSRDYLLQENWVNGRRGRCALRP